MEKILDLVKQIGGSEELGTQLVETINKYKADLEAKLQVEFQQRLEKAKQVCIEEVEREKGEIRRKVEIFLESRINTIDRQAQKQAAIGEAEATRTLKGIKSLVEGVPIGGKGEDQVALAAEVKQLRVTNSKLSEENSRLADKAVKVNDIAQKVLARNRVLESKLSDGSTVTESEKRPGTRAPITERFEHSRTPSGSPKTTREVAPQVQAKPKPALTESVDSEIAGIASGLDGTPAFIPAVLE